MNNLINIINKDGNLLVSSREVAENCGKCRFCTNQYIGCKTIFCTLGSHTVKDLKGIHPDCLIMQFQKEVK